MNWLANHHGAWIAVAVAVSIAGLLIVGKMAEYRAGRDEG